MSAEADVAAAGQAVTDFTQRTNDIHAQIQSWETTDIYAEDHKRQQIAALRQALQDEWTVAHRTVEQRLAAATEDAENTMRGARTRDVEAQAVAAPRARQVIDSIGLAAAVELFADEGDAAALRVAYSEIPGRVAATTKDKVERARLIAATKVAVESHLEQYATADEASAIRARREGQDQKARLEAAQSFAFMPSPSSRVLLGYAQGDAKGPAAKQGWGRDAKPSWLA